MEKKFEIAGFQNNLGSVKFVITYSTVFGMFGNLHKQVKPKHEN